MDFRLMFATFAGVFLAELGDKTQLATFAMAASAPSIAQKFSIFAGASLALIATSAIAVLLGDFVGRAISPNLLKGCAGVVFIILGTYYLWTSFSAS